MRTSTVLASILFGSFAAAAPVDKRALVYHTEVVYETIVIYTTVYDDDLPAAPTAASTSEALFYEKPSSSAVVVPTPSAAPVVVKPSAAPVEVKPSAAPVVVKPSSVYTPTPAAQTPTPIPTTEAAKPTTTPEPVYVAPTTSALAAVSTVAAVAVSDTTTTSGESYSDVDITIYDNVGGYGACGTKLYDTDMIVAIAQPAWGASTYDVQTGAATNPWCGQKVKISYGGASVTATIMDMCPGCSGHDLDLSVAAWNALGLTEKTRLKASWSKAS